MSSTVLKLELRRWNEAEAEALVQEAHERLRTTNGSRGGVSLTPIEKNVLSTIRFLRRPVVEEEVAQAMSAKTGYDEDPDVMRPVLRSLKKHGFVIDLPVVAGKLLWLGIQGDLENDVNNFFMYERHKLYRARA